MCTYQENVSMLDVYDIDDLRPKAWSSAKT